MVAALTRELRADGRFDIRHIAAFPRRTWWTRLPLLGDLIASLSLARQVGHTGDIILVHGAEYAWLLLLPFVKHDRPVVVVWHGVRSDETLPAPRNALDTLFLRLFQVISTKIQLLALKADSLIAVGPAVAASVTRYLSSSQNIRVIPNGVTSLGVVSSALQGLSSIGPASASAPLKVLWSGTSPYQKGLDIALEACALAREQGVDVALTVLGLSRDHAPPDYRSTFWIHWLGRIPPTRVSEVLPTQEIFLCTSRYEACSIAVLEALSAGLATIASPAVAWMVDRAGFVASSLDPIEYSDALIRLTDPERRRILSLTAKERAKSFTWHSTCTQYIDVFDALLARQH